MREYQVALFFHLLGALLFFGGIMVAGIASEAARRRTSPGDVAVLLGIARVGVLPVAVGGVLLPVFGLWLVHLGHWGYGSAWVDWALGLYVLAMALGGIGGRRPKRARLLAASLAARGEPVTAELSALLDDVVTRAINYLSLVAVLAILALMVFKP
ncbi:MAG TPA: DUF2269 family protein [Solirubrobacteraceae bacterium]|nr:DUF2269 family protein [Solirubrobacteraceae bacterium]